MNNFVQISYDLLLDTLIQVFAFDLRNNAQVLQNAALNNKTLEQHSDTLGTQLYDETDDIRTTSLASTYILNIVKIFASYMYMDSHCT